MSDEKIDRATPPRANDLSCESLPRLDWSGAEQERSLELLYARVERRALDCIAWYLKQKVPRARLSKGLRFAAISLAIIGGVMPLLQALRLDDASVDAAPIARALFGHFGELGYVAFALAAGCVLFDRFFGFSTSWMRFLSVLMRLQRGLREFQLDWALQQAERAGTALTPERLARLLARLREFSAFIDREVERETHSWIVEFQSNLSEFERLARHHATARRPGGADDDPPAHAATAEPAPLPPA